MKFLIIDSEGTQELLYVSKNKERIRLKYSNGYANNYIGKVCCELQQQGDSAVINLDGSEFIFDFCQMDYLRKVLNAWYEHLNSPWLSAEERKDCIYKLKKGRK